ncbi:MAG: c-type cytochrome [Rhodobiaceae bacterium]|nr:c-type cytochrome [Rhodobiaceae bacterium]
MNTGFGAMGRVAVIIAIVVAAVWALNARAQMRIDPKRGETIAKTWCVNCHLVSEGQAAPASADAPPFASLSEAEGYDDERIRAFLRQPHGAMEGFNPDEKQINDLIAYIRTQNP